MHYIYQCKEKKKEKEKKNKRKFCCCFSVAQLYLTLCHPMDWSTPGFPVLHYLQEFAQICVHWGNFSLAIPVSQGVQGLPSTGILGHSLHKKRINSVCVCVVGVRVEGLRLEICRSTTTLNNMGEYDGRMPPERS